MSAPKTLLEQVPRNDFRKELAYLRARRHALNSLIESLEQYLRYLPKKTPKKQNAA
jgi:hypothetical protein